jgi:hypothetical protein
LKTWLGVTELYIPTAATRIHGIVMIGDVKTDMTEDIGNGLLENRPTFSKIP